jgi:dihydropteroate synthase
MGILNITPDSFSDGGHRLDPDVAAADAIRMVADGADLLDIGGESTRPGAPAVPAREEWRRIQPVLERLRTSVGVPISIDTYKAEVAERALGAGASIVNDVSGLKYDPALADVVARHAAVVILMHNRGRSASMYAEAQYGNVVEDVITELTERGAAALSAGISASRIIYDPGLGFAKRAGHTLELLAGFSRLHALGRPLLSGPSRKSFLTGPLGPLPAAERVWGTAAAVAASVLAGAHIIRVHDVREMTQVVRVAEAIRDSGVPAVSPPSV